MNMKRVLFLGVVVALAAMPWSTAQGGGIRLGIGINIPLGGPAYQPYPYYPYPYYPYRYYSPYYVAPPPVYVQPAPVYAQPAPVYVQPAPATAPRYYYVPSSPPPAPVPAVGPGP
jgi:hypothetical protein